MPAGKFRKLPTLSQQPCIVPGKLADESQLGGLSSLLVVSPEPLVPRPPPSSVPLKKRYRDSLAFIASVQPVKPPPGATVIEKHEVRSSEERLSDSRRGRREAAEGEEDEEGRGEVRLKMWRSHILEENNNIKERRRRACKGQRYREFMWTNYTTRRKSNRWELNQDKLESSLPPAKKRKTAKSEKNHCDKSPSKISLSSCEEQTSPSASLPGSPSQTDSEKENGLVKSTTGSDPLTAAPEGGDDRLCQDSPASSPSPPSAQSDSSRLNISQHPASGLPHSHTIPLDQIKAEFKSTDETNNNLPLELSDIKKDPMAVIGSRKRKIRKQGIRRLTPDNELNDIVT